MNAQQIILRQMIEARDNHGVYATNNEVIGNPFLTEVIHEHCHKVINSRSKPNSKPKMELGIKNLFCRGIDEPLPDFLIRRLDETSQYNDHGSRERQRTIRRLLRKHFPAHFAALPIKQKYGSPERSYIVYHWRKSEWELINTIREPHYFPAHANYDGGFDLRIAEMTVATVSRDQVRRRTKCLNI